MSLQLPGIGTKRVHTDDDDEDEEMVENITPISMLQELAFKQQSSTPFYELVLDGSNPEKTFAYEVHAFERSAIGEGHSKKDAKHNAASNLIELLKGEVPDPNRPVQIPRAQAQRVDMDAVSTLLDICVEHNYPCAEFKVIQATGSSHAPEFTVECRVASIIRTGSSSSKKTAKQLAAKEMLDVLQIITEDKFNDSTKIVATIDNESSKKKLKTYRELKDLGENKPEGVRLCDRHFYYSNFDDALKQEGEKILRNDEESPRERVHLFCMAMKLRYEITDVDGNYKKMKMFRCLTPDYETCLIGDEDDLYSSVINYFKIMIEK